MFPTATPFPALVRWQWALYAMILLAVASFAHLEDTITPLVITVTAIAVAWLLFDSPRIAQWRTVPVRGPAARDRHLPKVLINSVVVIAACYFFYEVQSGFEEGGGHFFVSSLGHFIIVLLICKLFERRAARDIVQIMVLALLIVVASTMYSQSMSYAILLAFFFAVAIYVILLSHLHLETLAAAARVEQLAPASAPVRMFFRDARRGTLLAVVLLLPVAILVFLIVPRSKSAAFSVAWGGRGAGTTFQTGMSPTVQFHDFGQLAQSDEIVMEVRLTQNDANMGSPYYDPYFRAQVLDQYDVATHQWTSARDPFSNPHGQELTLEYGSVDILPLESYSQSSAIVQDYTVRQPAGHLLFTMAPAARVISNQFNRVYVEPSDLTVSIGELHSPLRYHVVSTTMFPLLNAGNTTAPAAADPFGYMLEGALPPEMPGIAKDIAGDLWPATAADLTGPRVRSLVTKYEEYLRRTYPYSLEFRQVNRRLDPTVDFLMNRKEAGGHCEFFASAMVMLCRATGIKARMVQGFHGAEYNSLSGTYLVRQLHAHAWAEVLLPDGGWMESDPSPLRVADDDTNAILRRWAHELMQIVQNTWLASVVSFDNESRHSLKEWLLAQAEPFQRFVDDMGAALKYAVTAPGEGRMRMTLLGPLVGIVVIFFWLIRRWRSYARGKALHRKIRRSVKLSGEAGYLDELLRLVSRRAKDEGRPEDQTPREYVERYASVLGDALRDIRWLVEIFYTLRFGGLTATPELRGELSTTMARVRAQLREVTPS